MDIKNIIFYHVYIDMPKKASTMKKRVCGKGKKRNRQTKRCRCRKVCKVV